MTKNIWAVGRNYIDHAKEMNAAIPSEPIIFLKSGACINDSIHISLPKWSNEIHYELEIALKLDHQFNFSDITLALDLTARDKQSDAKKNGTPWTLCKSFTGSLPCGKWVPLKKMNNFFLKLEKNGYPVQSGKLSEMIFSPEFLLNYLKERFPICPNDILLTGTPAGVGPLKPNDQLIATLYDSDTTNTPILTCHWNVK